MCARTDILFFFNDTATTEIYTLSLHDALPISGDSVPDVRGPAAGRGHRPPPPLRRRLGRPPGPDALPDRSQPLSGDRKSTRLNSSHANISYAVFCLKKKKISRMTPYNLKIKTP